MRLWTALMATSLAALGAVYLYVLNARAARTAGSSA